MKLLKTVFKAIQWIKNNSLLSPSVPFSPSESCVSSFLLMELMWDHQMFLSEFLNAVTLSSVKTFRVLSENGGKSDSSVQECVFQIVL